MRVYYNEFDPKAAAWLRELIAGGQIPAGDVDTRSIVDVKPEDLYDYDQCHFFAGIGGWPLALQLAGWDRPVWTGSCPCQPFSIAGAGKGVADERHLWPQFARLIAKCQPPVVFGEQVASKAGREWLAGVRADLEGMAYAVGAADLCAAGVGAPHIRQKTLLGGRRSRPEIGRTETPRAARTYRRTGCWVGWRRWRGGRHRRPTTLILGGPGIGRTRTAEERAWLGTPGWPAGTHLGRRTDRTGVRTKREGRSRRTQA